MNKTKLIQFRPYQKDPLDLSSIVHDIGIDEVNEFNLLGITLDTHLNWKKHVAKTKSLLSRFTYALSILKRNSHRECALAAYHGRACAWLRYGLLLWGHSTDANDLFILQKKCLRIIQNIRQTESCRPHFTQLKLLTLPSMYIMEAALFVKKNMTLFDFVKSSRRKNQLILPAPKIDLYMKSPYYRCIKIYNKIPETIKSENRMNVFYNNLKKLLINKCYYHWNEFMIDETLNLAC